MERAGHLLGRALRRIRRPEAGIAWLSSSWREVVGEALAAHTRPVRCERGHLEITADGKEWATQLQSMQQEFCAQINCAWGGDLVRDVTLVAPRVSAPDGVARPPHEFDNQHTPFIRRRRHV